jgi:hypothetical protein
VSTAASVHCISARTLCYAWCKYVPWRFIVDACIATSLNVCRVPYADGRRETGQKRKRRKGERGYIVRNNGHCWRLATVCFVSRNGVMWFWRNSQHAVCVAKYLSLVRLTFNWQSIWAGYASYSFNIMFTFKRKLMGQRYRRHSGQKCIETCVTRRRSVVLDKWRSFSIKCEPRITPFHISWFSAHNKLR